jgi:hypothetical protein
MTCKSALAKFEATTDRKRTCFCCETLFVSKQFGYRHDDHEKSGGYMLLIKHLQSVYFSK